MSAETLASLIHGLFVTLWIILVVGGLKNCIDSFWTGFQKSMAAKTESKLKEEMYTHHNTKVRACEEAYINHLQTNGTPLTLEDRFKLRDHYLKLYGLEEEQSQAL